ncbi:DUF1127 domain-containing protein [Pararhizobium sp. A13]|uniref:DUF1127 domain-containing protein n=1 Tax=Pararhizobium sp. A13 TaxID=3133975 RepID=UPI0032472D5A
MTIDIPDHGSDVLEPSGVRACWISVKSVGLAFVSRAAHFFEKRNSRITLSELSDEQLRDIGVTRSEAKSEVAKSWFWC